MDPKYVTDYKRPFLYILFGWVQNSYLFGNGSPIDPGNSF